MLLPTSKKLALRNQLSLQSQPKNMREPKLGLSSMSCIGMGSIGSSPWRFQNDCPQTYGACFQCRRVVRALFTIRFRARSRPRHHLLLFIARHHGLERCKRSPPREQHGLEVCPLEVRRRCRRRRSIWICVIDTKQEGGCSQAETYSGKIRGFRASKVMERSSVVPAPARC